MKGPLAGSRILVTAGPTREHADPVRFLSNPSTGAVGYAIADACARLGGRVVLVSGPTALAAPRGVARRSVVSALEMSRAVNRALPASDAFVATAAVSDWRFAHRSSEKRKKGRAPSMTVRLIRNPDILADAGRWKARARRVRPVLVGFSLETTDLERHAAAKLKAKNLDLIIGNAPATFGSDRIRALWIEPDRAPRKLTTLTKAAFARRLAGWIAKRLSTHPTRSTGTARSARRRTR